MSDKCRTYSACVHSVMLYGSEAWLVKRMMRYLLWNLDMEYDWIPWENDHRIQDYLGLVFKKECQRINGLSNLNRLMLGIV